MKKWYQKLSTMWSSKAQRLDQTEYIHVEPEQVFDSADGGGTPSTGLLSRLQHGSKRDQQIMALQEGYTELLDLIRSIRTHLDHQEEAQTKVLQSMDRFNQTLSLMDETSRKSVQTMTDLARRTRESEDLLRTMMERSERRIVVLMSILLVVTLSILGLGVYYGVINKKVSFLNREERPPLSGAMSQESLALVPLEANERMAAPEGQDSEVDLQGIEPVDTGDAEVLDDEVDESFDSPVVVEDEEPSSELFEGRRGFLFFRREK